MGEPAYDSFDRYVAGASGRLLRLAYLLTGNHADGEELVQESLSRVFLRWEKVAQMANRDAYIRQVVVNANRRRFRRHRVTEVLGAVLPDRPASFGALGTIEDRSHLAEALATLTRRQRTVVVLRYCEDLSEAEVAELMDCRPGTVKSQASRALARLREHPSLGGGSLRGSVAPSFHLTSAARLPVAPMASSRSPR